jgi:hypothetical protein
MSNITKYVHAALTAANNYSSSIVSLREVMGRKGAKAARAALLPEVASFYGVDIVTGERGDKFDNEAKNYEAAKKSLYRLMVSIVGTGSKKAESKPLPRGIKTAITGLLATYSAADIRRALAELTAKK